MGRGSQCDGQLQDRLDLSRFFCVMVVLIWNSIPAFLSRSIPRMASSKRRDAPENVVAFTVAAVDADTDPADSRPEHFPDIFLRQHGAVGCQNHPESFAIAVAGDFENVFPQQGLAPRENDNRTAEGGNLVEKTKTPAGVQFSRIGAPQGRSPAVDAGEVASPGDFPGDHPEGLRQNGELFALRHDQPFRSNAAASPAK